MAIPFLIIGLILFIGLVVVHEFGHFIAARRNGVEVEEFGIGFPPKAKTLTRKNGTEYTLNWLPLGGFVKLKGEHDSDTRPGSYGAAGLKTKMKIMVAGVVMNLLAAWVLFTIVALFGMPRANLEALPFYEQEQFTVASDETQVANNVLVSVVDGSPAAEAGLQSGDEITRIGTDNVSDAEQLPNLTEKYSGQTIDVAYERSGESGVVRAELNQERQEDQAYLGVAPVNSTILRYGWSAPVVGAGTTFQFADVTLRGLGYVVQSLFAGQTDRATDNVGGPVAVFKILSDSSSMGLIRVFHIIGLISVSLAVVNILPIPALDGGRAFVTLAFRAVKKPLTQKTEELIHGTGFLFLMGVIVLITIVDVRRFF
ncbi:MAG: M50 family metallopeptidase [Candidatus Saccharibacteria bacterium]|nr:M50 family metallopeptidase [Candidatus Saccharibacteria bacterium]